MYIYYVYVVDFDFLLQMLDFPFRVTNGRSGRGVACDRKFWSLVTAGTVTVSLFVAGAIFGHVGVSLLVASALFGDVGVSLLLAGAALAEIWVDSRSTMFDEE